MPPPSPRRTRRPHPRLDTSPRRFALALALCVPALVGAAGEAPDNQPRRAARAVAETIESAAVKTGDAVATAAQKTAAGLSQAADKTGQALQQAGRQVEELFDGDANQP